VKELLQSGLLLAALAVLPLVGCGGGDQMVSVSGTITWQGMPIAQGTVAFMPLERVEDGPSRMATGRIESDGTYRLSTFGHFDGAMPGQYRVAISDTGEFPFEALETEQPQTNDGVLPARYAIAHEGGLTAEVPADRGSVEIDFTLP